MVVLGILDTHNTWNLDKKPEDRVALLQKAKRFLPGPLRDPEVITEFAGLRPLRLGTGVRLEREVINAGRKRLQVPLSMKYSIMPLFI